MDRPARVGILQQHRKNLPAEIKRKLVPLDHLDAQRLRPRPHDLDGLRVTIPRNKNRLRLRILFQRESHRHRLRRGGRLIQQRGIRNIQSGEIDDHRLEIQQRLHAALRDFSLVRRVGQAYQPGFSKIFRWITGGVMQP